MQIGDVLEIKYKDQKLRALVIKENVFRDDVSYPVYEAILEFGGRFPDFSQYGPIDISETKRPTKLRIHWENKIGTYKYKTITTFSKKHMDYFLKRQPNMGWLWIFLSINNPNRFFGG